MKEAVVDLVEGCNKGKAEIPRKEMGLFGCT